MRTFSSPLARKHRPTAEYMRMLRDKLTEAFPGYGALLSADRHGQPDPQFRASGTHRCADCRAARGHKLQARREADATDEQGSRYHRLANSAAVRSTKVHRECGPYPRQQWCIAKRHSANTAYQSERQLSDQPDLLSQSAKSCELQHRGADAPISGQGSAGSAELPDCKCQLSTPDSGQSGFLPAWYGAGDGEPLRCEPIIELWSGRRNRSTECGKSGPSLVNKMSKTRRSFHPVPGFPCVARSRRCTAPSRG